MLKNPFKKYTCIKQYDITDCGAACLATISKHYGLKIPITKIREVAGTDKKGTNAYGVIKAAEQLGFTAKGVAWEVGSGKWEVGSGLGIGGLWGWLQESNLFMVPHDLLRSEVGTLDELRL